MSDSHWPQKYTFLGIEIWLRLVFMLIYIIALKVAVLALSVIIVIQFVIALIHGQANNSLLGFSESCIQFVLQVWRFLCFTSEEKPFPFRDWPE